MEGEVKMSKNTITILEVVAVVVLGIAGYLGYLHVTGQPMPGMKM